jgi:chromosome segregation ATPase
MEDKGMSMDDPEIQVMAPRKAQKLISKLLADLDDLEARYKHDKLESSSQVHRVELTNEELRTRIQVLQDTLEELKTTQSTQDGGGEPSSGPSSASEHVLTLRKRVNTLEGKLTLARKEIKRLAQEIEDTKDQGQSEAKEYMVQCDRLQMENDALKARLAEFESAKEKRGLMRRKKNKDGQDHFEDVENRIIDAYEKIARLEAERGIKDRQISTLKNEVTTLRMKDIANGKLEGTSATEADTNLLRSPACRSSDYGAAKDSDDAMVADLKAQLHEAQQILVKKDQELVIERAKAASTAAGLLARIMENNGNNSGSRHSHSSQRFM